PCSSVVKPSFPALSRLPPLPLFPPVRIRILLFLWINVHQRLALNSRFVQRTANPKSRLGHHMCVRYRNNSALNAWFCVEDATLPFTAKWLRNLSTSNQPPPRPPPSDLPSISHFRSLNYQP